MRRKFLLASFLSAVLIIVTFTSLATSADTQYVDVGESVSSGKSGDMSQRESSTLKLLLPGQLIPKEAKTLIESTDDSYVCKLILSYRDRFIYVANYFLELAEKYAKIPRIVKACEHIAEVYMAWAEVFQNMYDLNCGD